MFKKGSDNNYVSLSWFICKHMYLYSIIYVYK
uniref:Uncharacterized protein n=1 Tax=Rhizophora mucronata TaxID=61149 RepID=A0A2P2Q605_RHIMU